MSMPPDPRKTVLCMKWGDKYPPAFVNRLYNGVRRNLSPPFRFLCLTDNPAGLAEGVETHPIPDLPIDAAFFDKSRHGEGWRKLVVFGPDIAGLGGPVLFLDIDVVVTGDLDRLFAFEPGRFCIIRDWLATRRRVLRRLSGRAAQPGADSNSSVFRFDVPAHGYVYDRLLSSQTAAGSFRLAQQYLGVAVGERAFWPADWIVSFKRSCRPRFPLNLVRTPAAPADASVVVFHGHPNPDEAIAGYDGSVFRRTRPAPWLEAAWE
jgi:hypothetical protein